MIRITKNWAELLKDEFGKPYFKDLQNFLEGEYSRYDIYPKMENIFNALNFVKYEDVKVVIIGQDPYHEPNQAHGLAFSVQDGVPLPPSLQNIYKEIEDDLGITCEKSGDLSRWAKQGVLLLKHKPDCQTRTSKFTSRERLGNFHKRNHQTPLQKRKAPCFHSLGLKCTKFRSRNCTATPDFESTSPKSTFGISRIFWL